VRARADRRAASRRGAARVTAVDLLEMLGRASEEMNRRLQSGRQSPTSR
jgi:hypothetical protein